MARSRIKQTVVIAHPVMEGVDIRVGQADALAVQGRSGNIEISVRHLEATPRDTLERIPLLRGIVRLFAAPMDLFKAMRRGERFKVRDSYRATAFMRRFADLFQTTPTQLSALTGIVITIVTILAGMLLLPELVEALLLKMPDLTRMAVNVVCCMFRVLGFILSIYTVSHLRLIRRISEYHSAAKKVVNAYEIYGEHFTEEEARHASCTSDHSDIAFILICAILCIIAFAFLRPGQWLLDAIRRVGVILLVAAFYNEIHTLLENAKPSGITGRLRRPLERIQLLCALEPGDDMIEVALYAFRAALDANNGKEPNSKTELIA